MNKTTRPIKHKGSIYPNDKDELIKMFNKWEEKGFLPKEELPLKYKPKALIVPHDMYEYSGYTTFLAYESVKNTKFDNIVLLGPAHYKKFLNISISLFDNIETMFGTLEYNKEFSEKLLNKFDLFFEQKYHKDHSTETQVNFVKRYFPNARIIELIYAQEPNENIYKILKYILNNLENTLIIVSTDMNHEFEMLDTRKKDLECIKNIFQKNEELIDKSCYGCGKGGLLALSKLMKEKNWDGKFLNWSCDAMTTKKTDCVVSYVGALIYKEK